jgi:sec-independent protein translocase protein TatA
MGIHWQELIIILLIVLVLFGPRRLPEIGRSLGNGIREFRDSMGGKNPNPVSEPAPRAAIPVEAERVVADERADAK